MTKKVAELGIFLALALISSYIESLIPFYFGVPGIKLGLTNMIVVLLLYRQGPKEAFLVSLARILLAGFLFGNMFSILYSLAGGVLSFLIMWVLQKKSPFGIVPVSVAGGIFHNIGQIAIAALVVNSFHLFYYLPVLLIAGFVTGALIGLVSQEVMIRTHWIRQ